MAQPLADLRVWMPWMVARLTWSNDVQVELLRLLQPPLEDQVMPEDRNREVASEWESFVTMIPTVGVLAGGLSNTGSLPCAVACAAAVEISSAVAADATTTSPRTTSFRM